jgi:hypothetical protein
MGEQMLSGEYYYLGTQLPIDRSLTFYYAHPGFRINNILIILSVQVFVVTSERRPHFVYSLLTPSPYSGLHGNIEFVCLRLRV